MRVTKHGNPEKAKPGEFRFKCERCECEWDANRGDKGLNFSPPCCEFYAYMKCPECGETAFDR